MKKLTIGKQLGMGFGLVMLVLLATVVWSVVQQRQLSDINDQMFEHPFVVTNALSRADANIARINRMMRDEILADTPDDMARVESDIKTLDQDVLKDLALGRERFLGDRSQFDHLIALVQEWPSIRAKVIEYKHEGKTDQALAQLRENSMQQIAEINAAKKDLYTFAYKKAEEFQAKAHAAGQRSVLLTVALGTAAVLIAVLAGWIITRHLSQAMAAAVGVARRIADGDLTQTVEVHADNEVGRLNRALADMQQQLITVVGHVGEAADSVARASAEIAQGNQDLSARTESQAGALQQTAAAMEQLSGTVDQNAEHSRLADGYVKDASRIAGEGGEVVASVVQTMAQINEASRKIADIIGVIDSIAFQTNILALNAAVEAARAGEQGRGFAVVASEVRNLAARSADAAKEIKDLIQASVERVEAGAQLVNQAGSTMSALVGSVRKVSDIMGDISAASGEQSAGAKQVSTTVSQMDQTTQQNASLVEEMAAATDSLHRQALQLVQSVQVFQLPASRLALGTGAVTT